MIGLRSNPLALPNDGALPLAWQRRDPESCCSRMYAAGMIDGLRNSACRMRKACLMFVSRRGRALSGARRTGRRGARWHSNPPNREHPSSGFRLDQRCRWCACHIEEILLQFTPRRSSIPIDVPRTRLCPRSGALRRLPAVQRPALPSPAPLPLRRAATTPSRPLPAPRLAPPHAHLRALLSLKGRV